jgi:hypothetical protein
LCKRKHYDNIKLFFNTNIICVPFNEKNECANIKKILMNQYSDDNIDIFICGCHKKYLKSKITNKNFLNEKKINNNYTIDWDTITSANYSFIEKFYRDINLNITHFYEYYSIPSTEDSINLYKSVSNYYLIFIQYKSSNGKTLNISNLIKKYRNDNKVLLICNDLNLYDKNDKKHKIAQQFVFNKIINYVDIIKNSDEIFLIDSCFIGIVLPLLKTNRLKTKQVRIILRSEAQKHQL